MRIHTSFVCEYVWKGERKKEREGEKKDRHKRSIKVFTYMRVSKPYHHPSLLTAPALREVLPSIQYLPKASISQSTDARGCPDSETKARESNSHLLPSPLMSLKILTRRSMLAEIEAEFSSKKNPCLGPSLDPARGEPAKRVREDKLDRYNGSALSKRISPTGPATKKKKRKKKKSNVEREKRKSAGKRARSTTY